VDQGFLAGVPASWVGPEVLLVAVTEQRTRSQIDAFADALAAVLA
jgi:glycine cleavage system protein P-like pyridoxal-binding family